MDLTRPRTTGTVRTPSFPSQIGAHGLTVSEHEITPIYAKGLSAAANRPWLSAEQLGMRLASIYHGQKVLLKKPWEDPGGPGTAGLFDRSMGGDRVGKGSRAKGLPYVRSRGDAVLDPALGRYGYRTVSGYDRWRVDPNEAILNGCTGPHLLMPRSEAVSLKMERLLNQGGRGLKRTIPREKDPNAWMMYTPEKALSGGSRSTTFSVVFNLNRPIQIYHLLTSEEMEEAVKTMHQASLASRSTSNASSPAVGGGAWLGRGGSGSSPLQMARSPMQPARDGPDFFGGGQEDSPWLVASNRTRSDASASPSFPPQRVGVLSSRRSNMNSMKWAQVAKEDLGEQVFMSLIEFNREWGRLRGDVFAEHLENESSMVEAFVDERNRKQALAAERARQSKERELEIVEKLRNRAVHELNEAVEATSRAEKERSEFERAQEVLDAEKEGLKRMIADAEKDGHVDVEEQMMIDRLEFEVRVASKRLNKERQEYEQWSEMAQKEMQEAIEMAQKVQQEVKRRLEVEKSVKGRLGSNKAAARCSVLDRLEVHAINDKIELPELNFIQDGEDEWLCQAHMANGSGYVGGWKNGHANGMGIEMLPSSKYVGQFRNDMRHGIGSFSMLKSSASYVGRWVNGVRDGLGIACNLRPDGNAVPVVYCVCKNNEVVVAERWNESIKSHRAVLHEYQEAIKASTLFTDAAVARFADVQLSSEDSSGQLFGQLGRDPSESLSQETITMVSSNPGLQSPANRMGNVMVMLGKTANKHQGKARWRESDMRDEEVMLDADGFSIMELARKAAHCKDTDRMLMEQEQAELKRIEKMEVVVEHTSLFVRARPGGDAKDGGKLKAIISLSALLRPSTLQRAALTDMAPSQSDVGGGDIVAPMTDEVADESTEEPKSEESKEEKLKQKQKRHANPLLRMLMTAAVHKHDSEPARSQPKSTIGLWVAAGFRVANKDKWSGPAPEDIEAVESISRLRSLDAWESEDGGTENVTTSGGSTSDASHPILQPTSAVQTSESNNSNTATARAGKKRPKELAPVDGTPFKPQRRSSMRNSLLATVTSAQGSLAIEPQSGNSLPEQPACVTDLEDYQLLERPISRAGSTRQNSNSLQEGGQNSPYGSRKIDLMARGSQAEGNTSSVPINEIAPFQNDGGSQRSLFDSLESSQSDNVGPVGSWGFAL